MRVCVRVWVSLPSRGSCMQAGPPMVVQDVYIKLNWLLLRRRDVKLAWMIRNQK